MTLFVAPSPYLRSAYTTTAVNVTPSTGHVDELADDLVAAGAAVVVPHLSLLWHAISPAPIEAWYARDVDVLAHCHAVALLPGRSDGAEAEVTFAAQHGIPVYAVDHDDARWKLFAFIEGWTP